jgi:hypothetical protein
MKFGIHIGAHGEPWEAIRGVRRLFDVERGFRGPRRSRKAEKSAIQLGEDLVVPLKEANWWDPPKPPA